MDTLLQSIATKKQWLDKLRPVPGEALNHYDAIRYVQELARRTRR